MYRSTWLSLKGIFHMGLESDCTPQPSHYQQWQTKLTWPWSCVKRECPFKPKVNQEEVVRFWIWVCGRLETSLQVRKSAQEDIGIQVYYCAWWYNRAPTSPTVGQYHSIKNKIGHNRIPIQNEVPPCSLDLDVSVR